VSLCSFAGRRNEAVLVSALSSSSCIYPRARKHTPDLFKLPQIEHIPCDVTRFPIFPNSRCLAPFLPPFFLHTDRPKTLVYRDLISRHTLVVTSQITNRLGRKVYADLKTVCCCEMLCDMVSTSCSLHDDAVKVPRYHAMYSIGHGSFLSGPMV
jgi:hypothetical protein